jgi:hypothetical protein
MNIAARPPIRRAVGPGIAIMALLVAIAGCGPQSQLDPVTSTGPTATPEPTVESWPRLAAEPPFPTSCTAEPLPVPAGYRHARVFGGDPTGRFIIGEASKGSFMTDEVVGEELIWDNGQVTALTLPGDGRQAQLVDVNRFGEAVGYASTDFDGMRTASYYYHGGVLTPLKGDSPVAMAINDAGAIVGLAKIAGSVVPVVWRSFNADPEPLLPPEGYDNLTALFLEEDGSIVSDSYAWRPDGTKIKLSWAGVPSEPPVGMHAYHSGWALLRSFQYIDWYGPGDPPKPVAYAWHIGSGQMHQVPSNAEVINAHGWVVSDGYVDGDVRLTSAASELRLPRARAALYQKGFSGTIASFLSDDGHTIAGYIGGYGANTPIIWHCQ